ncbi:hypothetical protein ACP90_23885 [Labrenzia sp. CP4]|nr:hypothetical protein ACP90_23885 [Labrenzia sp. CP4]
MLSIGPRKLSNQGKLGIEDYRPNPRDAACAASQDKDAWNDRQLERTTHASPVLKKQETPPRRLVNLF